VRFELSTQDDERVSRYSLAYALRAAAEQILVGAHLHIVPRDEGEVRLGDGTNAEWRLS
jgi:diadenosine tetraphosphate (Ap4A) HIT family hydrolase